MSELSAKEIPAILDALVGTTGANGDTTMDCESMHNIGKLEAVCTWVCDRIYPAYSGNYPRQCASAEQVAHCVRRASGFILDYMGIDREVLLGIADEMEQAGKDYRFQANENAVFSDLIDDAPEEFIEYANRILEAIGATS